MVFYIVSCALIGYIGMVGLCEELELQKKYPLASNVCVLMSTVIGGVYGLSIDYPYLVCEDIALECINED